jgi:nucleotide-binding universal stress UspA family protein
MALLASQPRADMLDGMIHYLVDAPDGSVGILDGWERDEKGRPMTMIVAQGWFGRRRFEIPVAKLRGVDHDRRRIVLARGAAPLEPKGPFQRLLELGQRRSAEEAAAAFPRSPHQARPVLCGVADDPHAPAVVAVAARLAEELAAPLILTHVTPAHVPPGVSAAPNGQARLREQETEDADQLIDVLLSRAVSGTEVSRVVTPGMPAETLEDLARREGAQLLVIGSAGKGALGALLKGSVSHHLVNHATCPVVVVPPNVTTFPHEQASSDEESGDTASIADMAGTGSRRTS